jgi:hypothetical protein
MNRQSPTFTTGRFPRTIQEAFGPHAELHVPQRPSWTRRLCYAGSAICVVLILAVVLT